MNQDLILYMQDSPFSPHPNLPCESLLYWNLLVFCLLWIFCTFFFSFEDIRLSRKYRTELSLKLTKGKFHHSHLFSSVQSLSRVWLFATPWIAACQASMVHHHLLEFTQTHVHRVSDAIQPSHPGSSPSPPAPNPSQHQGLFQWVNSLHEVAKVLEFPL